MHHSSASPAVSNNMSPSLDLPSDLFFSADDSFSAHMIDESFYCSSSNSFTANKSTQPPMETVSLFDILEREFCAPPPQAPSSSCYQDLFDPTPILELEPTPIREENFSRPTHSQTVRPLVSNSNQFLFAHTNNNNNNDSNHNISINNNNNQMMMMNMFPSEKCTISSNPSSNQNDTRFGRYDVICSRGREFHKHPGCIRYRELIKEYQEEYRSSTKRVDKAVVIEMLVDRVREVESMSGETARFLKYNRKTDTFEEMDEKTVRDKVGHALRAN